MLPHSDNSKDWAIKKGIIRRCQKHNLVFDPYIGCPICNKENSLNKNIFENVAWPSPLPKAPEPTQTPTKPQTPSTLEQNRSEVQNG